LQTTPIAKRPESSNKINKKAYQTTEVKPKTNLIGMINKASPV
jgi:hypothetical protein